ncbi:MAG: exodeoxyribonuclease VII small subunit [Candidatus Moranbacteria bacterium]|nr:exodeoxyribonuclease VII small subunit [Candidatus Moranbacteria bacterium]
MASINLSESLKKLEEITQWFNGQDEVDVEKGLEKVKEGAKLIKASRERLKEVENEFEDVKKELEGEIEE